MQSGGGGALMAMKLLQTELPGDDGSDPMPLSTKLVGRFLERQKRRPLMRKSASQTHKDFDVATSPCQQ